MENLLLTIYSSKFQQKVALSIGGRPVQAARAFFGPVPTGYFSQAIGPLLYSKKQAKIGKKWWKYAKWKIFQVAETLFPISKKPFSPKTIMSYYRKLKDLHNFEVLQRIFGKIVLILLYK